MSKQRDVLFENLKISVHAVRSNGLRTILTMMIIAIGILALVGILTAIDAIKLTISNEFTRMGANTFTIQSRGMRVQIGDKRYRTKNHAQISYREAMRFKKEFDFPAEVSVNIRATGRATVKYLSEKTNPNIPVIGADENYLATSGTDLSMGRNFVEQEVLSGRNFVLLGSKIKKKLFKEKEDPIGKDIAIGNGRYQVIGILEEKGSSMGFSDDDVCIIPVNNVRQYFSRPNMSYSISVKPQTDINMEAAIGEAEGLFRVVRGLSAKDESDFNISKSDNLAQMLLENISLVTIAATFIGLITLMGAAIGLMNIMLVSVAERTREIGTRKALGATSKTIKQQFLFESVIIGQLGGIIGIIGGIVIGNIVASIVGSPFIIPWGWIIGGVILCLVVGLLSGLLPAIKASKLDPIEALRFE